MALEVQSDPDATVHENGASVMANQELLPRPPRAPRRSLSLPRSWRSACGIAWRFPICKWIVVLSASVLVLCVWVTLEGWITHYQPALPDRTVRLVLAGPALLLVMAVAWYCTPALRISPGGLEIACDPTSRLPCMRYVAWSNVRSIVFGAESIRIERTANDETIVIPSSELRSYSRDTVIEMVQSIVGVASSEDPARDTATTRPTGE